jgi:hypothetical protein
VRRIDLFGDAESDIHQHHQPQPDHRRNGGIAGDFVPQCVLENFAANGECGAATNAGWRQGRGTGRGRGGQP